MKKIVILKWNPAISSYSMLRFLQDITWEDTESDWSIYEYDKVKTGDQFFMLKVGIGTCGIVASGKITSDPVVDEDWSGRDRKVYYSDYVCDFMVNPETLPILESSVLEDNIPAKKLYETLDFKITKTYKGYNGYKKRKPLSISLFI